MPVFGTGGALIGALAISGPVTRLTKAVAKAKRDTLRAAGLALSRACGGLPPAKPAGPMEGRSR
jgi:DNA-binding IclR family transcriptional regulator